MNQDIIFSIKNLTCAYKADHPVLKIDQLELPKGKLIYFLGKSGVGKSTLTETLGLMNNTIRAKADTSIQFNSPQGIIDLSQIWEQGDQALSTFRTQYFSFIFQQTNLMPNFTSGENMCISQLLESKSSFELAKKKVLTIMKSLDLESSLFDKQIWNLSGGQRQRLAFVRAITSPFEVLFGDEPTGNLDRITSRKLVDILKEELIKQNKTGVFVSHDVELALETGDSIIVLTSEREDASEYGVANTKNMLIKKDDVWHISGETVEQPMEFIYTLLAT